MYKKDSKGGYKRTTAGASKRAGAGRSFGAGRDVKMEMFKTKCSECGNMCEVPFKPNGRKPVLCSHCFNKTSEGARHDNPGARRINESGKETFSATCSECGKSCGVPFKPNGKKPVLCSLCFAKGNSGEKDYDRRESKSKNDQFEAINKKLDQILKTLAEISER